MMLISVLSALIKGQKGKYVSITFHLSGNSIKNSHTVHMWQPFKTCSLVCILNILSMGITVAIAMGHTATPCNSMDDQ